MLMLIPASFALLAGEFFLRGDLQRECDIFSRGLGIEKVRCLEDHTNLASRLAQFAPAKLRQINVVNDDRPRSGFFQSRQTANERLLTGT